MLAPRRLPSQYSEWNAKNGAPFGRYPPGERLLERLVSKRFMTKLRGPFSIQPNNTTRKFEYPWVYYAIPSTKSRVLEIGGGLSGLQFVLSREGHEVVNVDPGLEAKGKGWPCDPESMRRLNSIFGTDVTLCNISIARSGLQPSGFDVAYCISVIEHLTPEEMKEVMYWTYQCLKPGCMFILTVDLFLDLYPFTGKMVNEFGQNIDVSYLESLEGFELFHGNKEQLFGYREFDPVKIQSRLGEFMIGSIYPAMAQCFSLRKPEKSFRHPGNM